MKNSVKFRSLARMGPHNKEVYAVLFGCLLGNAYAEKRKHSTRICFSQENANVAYLRWLHHFFAARGYCNPKQPKLSKRIGNKGKIRFYSRFHTWSYQSFNLFYEIFYKPNGAQPDTKVSCRLDPAPKEIKSMANRPSGDYTNGAKRHTTHSAIIPIEPIIQNKNKKIIPEKQFFELFFSPQSLAIWIMDDGKKQNKGLTISANCFSKEDLTRLSCFLYEKYNLKTTINSAGAENQYFLYFWACTMPILVKLVMPYMVPSMMYKLGKYVEY